jgi:hypothetical protein
MGLNNCTNTTNPKKKNGTTAQNRELDK